MDLEILQRVDGKFIEARCSGAVTRDSMIRAIAQLRSVNGYIHGLPALWDFREADISSISVDDMKSILAFMQQTPLRKNIKIAILVASSVDLLLIKLWDVLASREASQKSGLFLDRDEAVAWLEASE